MCRILYPAVPGSSYLYETQHQLMPSSESGLMTSRCAELNIQPCQNHIQLCKAPHPCVGDITSLAQFSIQLCSIQLCRASGHSMQLARSSIQLCRTQHQAALGQPGHAGERAWTCVGHGHRGRSSGRDREDFQPAVDSRDSLQRKGRESFGRMEVFHHGDIVKLRSFLGEFLFFYVFNKTFPISVSLPERVTCMLWRGLQLGFLSKSQVSYIPGYYGM